ncbi:ulp1 protease family protein [Diplodia corticola]|uniref:Ulp1 protease family protein n=1 Tax=Diplodia corticola TaxID=236234 RepID=A0A1J9RES3_9PEZI|nr:ulp1 protease family protein [Diplodia corticola]OJD31067.1 ulp1 protease family protein [Diplodia corticola]
MSGFHPFKGRVSRHFGENLAPDDAILSYYDIRLTKEDIDCIKCDWLTDNAIAFWEEWLEHEHLSAYPKANISLLRPSMSFMMIQTPDPLTLKEALPNFSRTTHIFLPINDCRNVMEAEGGSHWSLLLVSVVDGVAFHYDSLCESNDQEARVATQKMATLLGRSLRFISMDDCPQQENGSDCGVFVCLLMRYLLLNRLLRADSKEKVSMSMAGKNVEASAGRKEMLKIIDGFRKEGRRRSRSKSPFSDHSKSPPRIGDE